jgi:hypothetical protein
MSFGAQTRISRRDMLAMSMVAGTALPVREGRGETAATPVIGLLGTTSTEADARLLPFRQALREAGYVEGQNVVIEYRGRKASGIASRHWPPIWFVAKSACLYRSEVLRVR